MRVHPLARATEWSQPPSRNSPPSPSSGTGEAPVEALRGKGEDGRLTSGSLGGDGAGEGRGEGRGGGDLGSDGTRGVEDGGVLLGSAESAAVQDLDLSSTKHDE